MAKVVTGQTVGRLIFGQKAFSSFDCSIALIACPTNLHSPLCEYAFSKVASMLWKGEGKWWAGLGAAFCRLVRHMD